MRDKSRLCKAEDFIKLHLTYHWRKLEQISDLE